MPRISNIRIVLFIGDGRGGRLVGLDRRSFLHKTAAALCAPALPPGVGARAAEFTLKYANNLSSWHPLTVRTKEAIEAILQETGGRVAIQFVADDQIDSNADLLNQLRGGAISLLSLSGLSLSRVIPVAAICGSGFAWESYDRLWAAMDGALGGLVRGEIGKSGLFAMERMWDNGFRQITTSARPIVAPDDLRGLKIRVPSNPLWIQMFKAFGSNPIVVSFGELHSALKSKTVAAQENPLVVVNAARLNEVQTYLSLTNHMWDGFWSLANGKAWNTIPDALRAIVVKHFDAAALKERDDMVALNANLLTKFGERGMIINQPDRSAFRERLRSVGFFKDLKAIYPDEVWAVFEEYSGISG